MYRYFLIVLFTFHISELLFICIYCRQELSWSSTLCSLPYASAMLFATMEYWLQVYYFGKRPEDWKYCRLVGMVFIVAGECIRKLGMFTLGSKFSHRIRTRDHPGLVTRGIYGWIRHPAYCGWFLWCIGTQLLLVNPISCILFAVLSWKFFRDRIRWEEETLVGFYGVHFQEKYRNKVWSGIPFI
ncbi:hypothetical protein GAYE_SCF16G3624 [Galdieria yellowstonensis]|uniref:Protein-S-isoprenylcysteine O-methyltransferase n=1 Tax=Galdieria yellowstonensis TaxID=3028027 RepID=A0AAV9IE42_9RHOD|nr:hypothetical protein GAYE_SCF16G3624 [Galdieria yellowstonensis]